MRSSLPFSVFLAIGVSMSQPAGARQSTFEERVKAQRAIEQVYWSHRDWPNQNPQPKPSLSAVMPEATIRAKVENYLEKSKALERWWQRPITGRQLQAELDRIVKQSRDPSMLRELFDALGDDPFLIAETLVRQTLADRLVRNWYATDERFHGSLRDQANASLSRCSSAPCMKTMGGAYSETTVKLDSDGDPDEAVMPREGVVTVDDAQWKALALRLKRIGVPSYTSSSETHPGGTGPAGTAEIGRLSGLEETVEAFQVTSILSRRENEIVIATTTWPKRTFDSWWDSQRGTLSGRVETTGTSFVLPAVSLTACADDTWRSTEQEVPDARHGHTAVWTGSEMIIWGGDPVDPALRSGGRYSPATDTWTATSLGANVPERRGGHTAVWTGTEMIVWGGQDYDPPVSYLWNTGGRYNPTTDTWTATSTGANAPIARTLHSAVWTGSQMIIWGGVSGSLLNTGGRYDPATDTWTPTSTGPNVPAPRCRHTAVWTDSEMIVWGGQSPNLAVSTNTGGRYDPSSDTWRPTSTGPTVPDARVYHSAIWTGARMIVWGGQIAAPYPEPPETSTGALYDPATDTWTATPEDASAPRARCRHTAVWTGNEMIVWGGQSANGQAVLNTGGRYDPIANTWVTTSLGSGLPAARTRQTAVWTGSEMIVWGGHDYYLSLSTGGRYDPVSNTWTPTSMGASVPSARESHTAIWSGAEMIVWGGLDYTLTPTTTGGRYSPATDSWIPTAAYADTAISGNSFWTGGEMILWGKSAGMSKGARYDPSTDAWAPMSSVGAPSTRLSYAGVWTGTEMIVWGGSTSSGSSIVVLNTGGRYDPVTDHWSPTSTGANVPAPRRSANAVWTGTQMIVWGGETYNGAFTPTNTGGRYDPASDRWSPTSTGANVPSARLGSAVWTGSRMIIWGGASTPTGGLYDPALDRWSPTSTGVNVPSARKIHTAVWTGREMIVWGGLSGSYSNNKVNTGGRYDPSADAWLATSTGPFVAEPRYFHTAVWTGSAMIVWGGELGYPSSSGALYCACPMGRLVYRDADDDGHGNPAISRPSCDGSIPAGYVEDRSDCDDSNSDVHPGAAELCNGVDDDCNGTVDDDGASLCDDGNPCTDDSCDATAGCAHVDNSSPCDDADACTVGDVCAEGVCQGRPLVPKVDCNDGNTCTNDYCDSEVGCLHYPKVCRDNNPCTIDSCDPRRGCIFRPQPGCQVSIGIHAGGVKQVE